MKSKPNDNSPIYLHGIHTAVPEHRYSQEMALRFMQGLAVYDDRQKRFLERIYRGSAIESRHSVIGDYDKPPEEYEFYPPTPDLQPEPTLAVRNARFVKEADRLSLLASRGLLERLPRVDPGRITHLITVSCTGFSAPGFDFTIARGIPLARGIHRFHLGFMGCYAAFPALKLARSICIADPAARVLIVTAELCTLHFQQRAELDFMVANAIFADGVAAALVSADPADSDGSRLTLEGFSSAVIEGSESDMAWTIGERAFDMRLSAYVPKFIEANIASIVEELLGTLERSREEIALWAIHPGGRAILDRVVQVLGLTYDDLAPSYGILRDYGNMSSSTILFVLARMLREPGSGLCFSCAFGPGLTVESALFRKEEA